MTHSFGQHVLTESRNLNHRNPEKFVSKENRRGLAKSLPESVVGNTINGQQTFGQPVQGFVFEGKKTDNVTMSHSPFFMVSVGWLWLKGNHHGTAHLRASSHNDTPAHVESDLMDSTCLINDCPIAVAKHLLKMPSQAVSPLLFCKQGDLPDIWASCVLERLGFLLLALIGPCGKFLPSESQSGWSRLFG